MNIEERLRSWATEERGSAIPVDVPVERFVSRRRSPRVAAMAAAAALVVAMAVAITLTRSNENGATGGGEFRFPPGTAQRPPAPAPGKQIVTFHGITVTAPKAWPLDAVRCGAPARDTVAVIDGAGASCGLTRIPDVSSVTFQTLFANEPVSRRSRPVHIGGLDARRSDTSDHGASVIQIDVKRLAARITIRTPTRRQGDSLADTLALARTDENGCPSRIAAVPLDQVAAHGQGRELVAGNPDVAVLCSYFFGYLERSRIVAATPLIAKLHNLPAGLSHDPQIGPDDQQCWDFKGIDSDAYDDASSFVIRLTSNGGSLQQLYVRIALCGKLGVTNGTATGQRTQPLIDALHAVLVGASWPGNVKPVG